jgi:hypothetical protein
MGLGVFRAQNKQVLGGEALADTILLHDKIISVLVTKKIISVRVKKKLCRCG